MNYFKRLKKHLFLMIVFLFVAFWLGFFFTEYVYNNNNTYYEIKVTANISEDINSDFFKNALAKYENGEFIGYSYNSVKPDAFFKNNDIKWENDNDIISIKIKAKYFISSQGATISSDSETRFLNVMKKVFKYYDQDYSIIQTKTLNYESGYLIGLYSLLLGIFLEIVIYSMCFLFVKEKEKPLIYDNQTLFAHPFSKNYWISSFKSMTKMRVFDLCLLGILFSLQMCCKMISIPSGFANLGIGITYLIFSFICVIYGPIWGLVIGFFSDVLGFFIFPNGNIFFFGYTIQAMLTGFVYGIFLYKTDITFEKCFSARLIINLLLNAIFGSILWGLLMGLSKEGMWIYFVTLALPKNIIYLVPQSIVMYFFIKMILPIFKGRNIISNKIIEAIQKKTK